MHSYGWPLKSLMSLSAGVAHSPIRLGVQKVIVKNT